MPQPTKLPKPITLTFETVEEALAALAQFYAPFAYACEDWDCKFDLKGLNHLSSRNFNTLLSVLKSAGIDWRTWEPPQPFKIGAHETAFNPNGSIKVGCTDIDRATLLEVLKRSDQAMQKVEEWPRWFQYGKDSLLRFESEQSGQWYSIHRDDDWPCSYSLSSALVDPLYKQITRAEASAILGRDV